MNEAPHCERKMQVCLPPARIDSSLPPKSPILFALIVPVGPSFVDRVSLRVRRAQRGGIKAVEKNITRFGHFGHSPLHHPADPAIADAHGQVELLVLVFVHHSAPLEPGGGRVLPHHLRVSPAPGHRGGYSSFSSSKGGRGGKIRNFW